LLLRFFLWSIVLATAFPTFGQESDKRTPLERYEGDSKFTLYKCKLTLKLAIAKSELGREQDESSDWAACIRDGKATVEARFDPALSTIRKAKAKEALKSYQVAFVVALEGIAPGSDERRINYEQRQQALDGRLTEAWARFQIEK
jgi:hypothetical protein